MGGGEARDGEMRIENEILIEIVKELEIER